MSHPTMDKQIATPHPDLVALGKKLVQLGEAMQKPETVVTELSGLAWECGLVLEFRMTAKPSHPTPADGTSDSASERQEGK